MRARGLLLSAALIIVVVGDARAGPVPQPPQSARQLAHDLPRLRDWIDAVDRHHPGEGDIAAIGVGSWSRAQLEVLLLDLKALLQLMSPKDRPRLLRLTRAFTPLELKELQDLAGREAQRVAHRPVTLHELTVSEARKAVNRLVKRAALLHTDIALLVPAATDTVAESHVPVLRALAPRSTAVVADGRQVGFTYYGAHWDVARLLLDEVRPDPAGDAAVRQWYRVVAASFASEHRLAESDAHLVRARELFPADPEIAAASGRLHEAYAAPRVQNFLETGASGGDLTPVVGSSRSNVRQAETFFSKAVRLDGGFVEARLHLGRVLSLEGRHEAAAAELRRAALSAADPLTKYYVWLFLGVEEQSLGRTAAARESFDKAVALYPRAQSPYLALSQLARRHGDQAGALRAIHHVLELSADDREREDPWWTYLAGSAEEAELRLSDLRAALFLTPDER
jgi:tetratricopeptide (TPR) repeat protein